MTMIDSNQLARNAGGKPVPTFPHSALAPYPPFRLSRIAEADARLASPRDDAPNVAITP